MKWDKLCIFNETRLCITMIDFWIDVFGMCIHVECFETPNWLGFTVTSHFKIGSERIVMNDKLFLIVLSDICSVYIMVFRMNEFLWMFSYNFSNLKIKNVFLSRCSSSLCVCSLWQTFPYLFVIRKKFLRNKNVIGKYFHQNGEKKSFQRMFAHPGGLQNHPWMKDPSVKVPICEIIKKD